MAFGISSVAPLGNIPGAYNVQLKDGKNMTVTGQPGQDLFARYGGAPTAGQTVGTRPDGTPVARMPLAKAKELAPPAPAAPTLDPAAAAPSAPQLPSAPTSLGHTMKAIDPATGKEISGQAMLLPNGQVGVWKPPTRGSPGGLTDFGKKFVQEANQMEATVAQSRADEIAAREEGVMLAREQASREQSFAEEQKIQNMLAAQDQQDEVTEIERQVAQRQATYERLNEEAMTGKVDENQYMKGATGIFLALGMALGAAGAVLGRTSNFAGDFVQGQIDRNIRRQEAELALKGKRADNALGSLLRETGSLKDAKLALSQILTQRAALEANVIATTAKDQRIAAQAKEAAAQFSGIAAQQDKARRQGNFEHVMSNRLYYQAGSSGSPGGFLTPTMEQMQGRKNLQDAGGPGGSGGATPAAAVEQITGMGQAILAANKIEEQLSARELSEKDDPVSGPVDWVKQKLYTDDARAASELDSNTQVLAKGIQAAFGASDRDAKDAYDMATGGGSGADRLRSARSLRERAIQTVRQQLAALPPAQQQQQLAAMPPEARAAILGQKKK
jgi:hypothetical protein